MIENTYEEFEILGIDDYPKKIDFGRERGPTPSPSTSQVRDIEKLNSKMKDKTSRSKKDSSNNGEEEENLSFDIRSKPRVVLYEGPLYKKSNS